MEYELHTDNMVSDLTSFNAKFPEHLDDFLLFSCVMLASLLCLDARWFCSSPCVPSRSLTLLFSMSLFTIGDTYVT